MKRTAVIPSLTTTRTGRTAFCATPAQAPNLHSQPAPGSVLQHATARTRTLAAIELAAHPDRGTATVNVWGGTTLTVSEPTWCTGKHGADPEHGDHPEDITHAGDEVSVEITLPSGDREVLLYGWLTSNPFSSSQSAPRVAIGMQTGDCEDYDVASLDHLLTELRAGVARIEGLRDQLAAAEADR